MERLNSDAKTSNSRLRDYLRYFAKLKTPPGYAILLNGEWGSGKTWFIKNFQKEHSDLKFLYVSLYGVSSSTEIENQFFRQLHPVLASAAASIGAKVLTGALKTAFHVDLNSDSKHDATATLEIPKINVQKFLSNSENCIIIFDDLERCPNLQELLGYINHFVEHQGQKVILIGHEKEIDNFEQHKRKNEKLIGRAFTITPEISAALEVFLSDCGEPVQTILKEHTELIAKVYDRSSHANLRTLKYSILEYNRFYDYLPEKAKQHKEFQASCINTFFSFCIELRTGKITNQDLRDLQKTYNNYQAEKVVNKNRTSQPDSPVETLLKHFRSFQDIYPNEESLYYFFEHGSIPEPIISDAIRGSKFFVQEDTPTWIKLWHVYDLTDDDFEKYVKEVIDLLKSHRFTAQGELRHVVGMIISFSKNGLIDLGYEETVNLVETTVDEMISKDLVEPLSFKQLGYPRFDDAHAGLQYQSREDDCSKRVSDSLRQYQERRKTEYIKNSIPSLVECLESDPEKLYSMLTSNNAEDVQYCELPVLQHIPVQTFLDTYIKISPENHQRMIVGYIFRERYSHLNIYPNLVQELPWLKELQLLIDSSIASLRQPTRFHLQTMNDGYLAPAIKKIEKWQSNQGSET